MTRVLVTGANGCIGAWVVRDLVTRGIDVIAGDIGSDTHRLDLVMDGESRDRVVHVASDVTDLAALERLIDVEDDHQRHPPGRAAGAVLP